MLRKSLLVSTLALLCDTDLPWGHWIQILGRKMLRSQSVGPDAPSTAIGRGFDLHAYILTQNILYCLRSLVFI